jgi:hypothetical protein
MDSDSDSDSENTPQALLECVPYDDHHHKVSFLIESYYAEDVDKHFKNTSPSNFTNIIEACWRVRSIVDDVMESENSMRDLYYLNEEKEACKKEYNDKMKQLKEEHEKKLIDLVFQHSEEIDSYSEELETHKQTLEELKREHEKRMTILQKEKEGLKQEKSTLLTMLNEKEEAMNIFKKQVEGLVQKALEPIKNNHREEILRMEKQYKEEKARMENTSREEKNRMESSSNSEILRLETAHKEMRVLLERNHITENERLKKKLEEQEERIQHLYSELKQSQASVIKGSVGQADFLELVKQHTDWTNMEDTSKIARAGDLKGFIGKVETMFEVKNYSADVPGKEVTKFIRDMEVHSNIPYGVFVSMTSGIANKKGDVSFQWTSHGQLCIFFGNFLKHDMEMSLKYIGECSGIGHRFFTLSQGEENNEAEIYRDKLIQVKTIITKQLSDVSEMNASMIQHKKLHLDNINKHYTEYKMGMDKMKVLCNEIIDIIVGESMESTIENEVVEENMVEGKKKRGRKAKGESSATASL